MACFVQYAVLLLLALQYQITVAFEPLTILSIATTVISLCQSLWDAIEKSKILDRHSGSDAIENPFWGGESDEEKILKELRRISSTNDQVKKELNAMKDMLLGEVTVDIVRLQKLIEILRKIFTNILIVENTYIDFLEYVERSEEYDKSLLVKFAEDALTEGPCGIVNLLIENNHHISKNLMGVPTLQDMIVEHKDIFLKATQDSQSSQQFLYNLMNIIIRSEVKAYFILRYSTAILNKIHDRNYDGHNKKIDKDLSERLNKTIDAFKEGMKKASREFFKTDPDEHIEDKTYLKLKHVYQAMIINERILDKNNVCSNYCPEGNFLKAYECVDDIDKEPLCWKTLGCKGWLIDCGYKIKNPMKICLVEDKWTSDRRYEYLIDGENSVKGKKNINCPNTVLELSRFAHHSFHAKSGYCDYCTCTCYESTSSSDNQFSVRVNEARHKQNYVVTGARFVKDNHIIYLQLQEGKLQPGGYIDENTVKWASYWDSPQENFVIKGDGPHYIDLEDVHAPEGHIIVGIGLKEISEFGFLRGFGLQILTKPFNFTTGKLLDSPSEHKAVKPSWPNNNEIDISETDIPINSIGKSVDISQSGQYIKLQRSGIDQDLGQNTIPFFDKQPVTTSPSSILSGIGLYHKSRENSGGFVGIRLFTLNYEPYIKPDL